MNEIELIQPYYPKAPFECFTDLDEKLSKHFDHVYETSFPYTVSPRFFYQSGMKFTLRDTYWYIDKLYKSNPSAIIDVGCGECEWKRWFPNITGVDISTNPWTMADIIAEVNDNFYKEHQGRYDCGMSLNSLFFCGLGDWNLITKQIHSMMGLVKDQFLFSTSIGPTVVKNLPTELQLSSNFNLLMRTVVDIISTQGYELVLLDLPSHRDGDNWSRNWNTIEYFRPPHTNLRFILKHIR